MRGTPFGSLCLALWASAAMAADVDASLTGLLQARPVMRAGEEQTLVPFFAQMGLSASRITLGPVENVRVGLGAWGRVALLGDDTAGDVDMAFVSGQVFSKHLTVTLGRQFRTGGALRALHFDGATADLALPAHLGLAVLGGVPVIPRFAVARGDALWGGRLYWRPSWDTEVGASYLEMMDHGYMARRDVALDGRTQVARRLALTGLGVFSLAEKRLVEIDVSPRFKASEQVELTGTFRQSAPDLFLPRTSILSVFAETDRTEGALGVNYQPNLHYSAGANARAIAVPEGLGYEAAVLFGYRPSRVAKASLQVVRLGLPSRGYSRARIAGGRTWGNVTVSLDLDGVLFDAPINGRLQALQAQLNARLPLPASLDLVVSGLASTDPRYQQRFEVLARLIYTFSSHSSEDSK